MAQTYITGLQTNLNYLKSLVAHPALIRGNINTQFIEQHHESLKTPTQIPYVIYAAAVIHQSLLARMSTNPWQKNDGWQNCSMSTSQYRFIENNNPLTVKLCKHGHDYTITINERTIIITDINASAERVQFLSEGKYYNLALFSHNDTYTVFGLKHHWLITLFDALNFYTLDANQSNTVTAPMPGTVVAVMKKNGDIVMEGEVIIVIEAMKMEHSLRAPYDGVIDAIHYEVSQSVSEGAELVSFIKETS